MKNFKYQGKIHNSVFVYRRVQTAFKTACEKAGIVGFRWHDLRHDFASMLVQRGVDIYTVQILLGHKDGRMTRRYAHLSAENLRSAIQVLDKKEPSGNSGHNLDTILKIKESKNCKSLI